LRVREAQVGRHLTTGIKMDVSDEWVFGSRLSYSHVQRLLPMSDFSWSVVS